MTDFALTLYVSLSFSVTSLSFSSLSHQCSSMKHLVNARVMHLYLATVAVSESVSYLNVHSIKQTNPIKISARRVNIFVLPLLLGSINYTLGRVSDSQCDCDQSFGLLGHGFT